MKRISFKIILVSIVAIAISYSVNQSKSKTELSELVLANVEALARYEYPEYEIVCGQNEGICWEDDGFEWAWTPFGGFKVTCCRFLGYTWSSCYPGLPA